METKTKTNRAWLPGVTAILFSLILIISGCSNPMASSSSSDDSGDSSAPSADTEDSQEESERSEDSAPIEDAATDDGGTQDEETADESEDSADDRDENADGSDDQDSDDNQDQHTDDTSEPEVIEADVTSLFDETFDNNEKAENSFEIDFGVRDREYTVEFNVAVSGTPQGNTRVLFGTVEEVEGEVTFTPLEETKSEDFTERLTFTFEAETQYQIRFRSGGDPVWEISDLAVSVSQ